MECREDNHMPLVHRAAVAYLEMSADGMVRGFAGRKRTAVALSILDHLLIDFGAWRRALTLKEGGMGQPSIYMSSNAGKERGTQRRFHGEKGVSFRHPFTGATLYAYVSYTWRDLP